MSRWNLVCSAGAIVALLMFGGAGKAQVYDIFDFDETSEGPWSDIDHTTLQVWQVTRPIWTRPGRPAILMEPPAPIAAISSQH